jgi:hypothetical protein
MTCLDTYIHVNNDDEGKKLELIRQRMELSEEQTKLKEMLVSQEAMLKAKQVS